MIKPVALTCVNQRTIVYEIENCVLLTSGMDSPEIHPRIQSKVLENLHPEKESRTDHG